MKHKHATEIIAWANGATIEVRVPKGKWMVSHSPYWHVDHEYRVKPKPDVVRYAPVYPDGGIGMPIPIIDGINFGFGLVFPAGIIRITIDGETGKLAVEVVE